MPAGPTRGYVRQVRSLNAILAEYVEYYLTGYDEIVGNDAPVAPPPNCLGTHNYGALCVSQFAQPRKSRSECVGHGVIGVIVKALVRPVGIISRRNFWVSVAQTTESTHVLISDLNSG